MKTTIEFNGEENQQANLCININRIIRVLDSIVDYTQSHHNPELENIIQDYLNLIEQ